MAFVVFTHVFTTHEQSITIDNGMVTVAPTPLGFDMIYAYASHTRKMCGHATMTTTTASTSTNGGANYARFDELLAFRNDSDVTFVCDQQRQQQHRSPAT